MSRNSSTANRYPPLCPVFRLIPPRLHRTRCHAAATRCSSAASHCPAAENRYRSAENHSHAAANRYPNAENHCHSAATRPPTGPCCPAVPAALAAPGGIAARTG